MFDIGGVLSGGFEEGNTKLVGESLGFRILHNLFSRQIRLVTNQELVDTFNSVSIDFLQPLLNIGVGVPIGDVVDYYDTVRTSVVRRGNGPESLLSGSVPDLELDSLAFKLDGSDFKVNLWYISIMSRPHIYQDQSSCF